MAQDRASEILGLNVTLFGLGVGDGEGAGADWDGLGGSRVGVTGLGGVRTLRDGSVIEAGDERSGIGTPSARPWVEGRVVEIYELEVEGEELMVLSG